ncbi:MAG: hypothetical protein JWR09_3790 [Mucilaginibacter sp.]|nr:hypothetical protein [Mucilaginibacter sp.]
MFDEYKACVLKTYLVKQKANTLSPNLMRPTPKKLRDECLEIFNRGLDNEDLAAIKAFFGYHNDKTEYIQTIRRFDTDKLKPLDNFIKENTADTEDKNVELLAWLIGYKQRPYEYGQTYKIEGDEKKPKKIFKEILNNKNTIWQKYAAVVLVLLLSSGGYMFFKGGKQKENHTVVHLAKNGKHMYWVADHYLAIPAYQVHGDTPVVPLDTQVLNHLKKITDISSINDHSLGKVWYARLHKDDYEYFTDSGFHPIDTAIRLRPITKFIIYNHILNHKN